MSRTPKSTDPEAPMRDPVHPGEFIRAEILEPHGLTVTAGAKVLGVSRPALSNLLNGQADLSGDMALRIEKAFGVRMETLMRMQSAFDIAQTRQRATSITVRPYRRRASDPISASARRMGARHRASLDKLGR